MDDDVKFWVLVGVVAALVFHAKSMGRLVLVHDEILHKIVHGDPDAELAAMTPVREGGG